MDGKAVLRLTGEIFWCRDGGLVSLGGGPWGSRKGVLGRMGKGVWW